MRKAVKAIKAQNPSMLVGQYTVLNEAYDNPSDDGGFLEAMMGESWSMEKRAGWDKMMQHYRAVLANTRPPRIVGFNVHGRPKDYRFFRFAYASCLLDDGYFS